MEEKAVMKIGGTKSKSLKEGQRETTERMRKSRGVFKEETMKTMKRARIICIIGVLSRRISIRKLLVLIGERFPKTQRN